MHQVCKKRTQIFVPSQRDTVVTMARRRDPYTFIPLKHTEFLDYKYMKVTELKSQSKSANGQKISWTKIRHLRFVSGDIKKCISSMTCETNFNLLR